MSESNEIDLQWQTVAGRLLALIEALAIRVRELEANAASGRSDRTNKRD